MYHLLVKTPLVYTLGKCYAGGDSWFKPLVLAKTGVMVALDGRMLYLIPAVVGSVSAVVAISALVSSIKSQVKELMALDDVSEKHWLRLLLIKPHSFPIALSLCLCACISGGIYSLHFFTRALIHDQVDLITRLEEVIVWWSVMPTYVLVMTYFVGYPLYRRYKN